MPVTVDVIGLDSTLVLLRQLEKVATVNKGVSLKNQVRQRIRLYDKSAGPPNDELLKYLNEQGREFDELSNDEVKLLEVAYAAEYQRRIHLLIKKQARAVKRQAAGKTVKKGTRKSGRAFTASDERAVAFLSGKGKGRDKVAKQIANACLKMAMFKYMDIITEHIESQTGPGGAALSNPELTPEYAKLKKKDWGFEKPIGKRSAQLLDNLNADGVGGRNIKIQKS